MLLASRLRAVPEFGGLPFSSSSLQQRGIILKKRGAVGVIERQRGLSNDERLLITGLRLADLSLAFAKATETVQGICLIGVLRGQFRLAHIRGVAQQSLGFFVRSEEHTSELQ